MPGRHKRGLASEIARSFAAKRSQASCATQLWKMLTGPKSCPWAAYPVGMYKTLWEDWLPLLTGTELQSLRTVMVPPRPLEVVPSSFWVVQNALCQTKQYHKHPQKTQDGDGDAISSWQIAKYNPHRWRSLVFWFPTTTSCEQYKVYSG